MNRLLLASLGIFFCLSSAAARADDDRVPFAPLKTEYAQRVHALLGQYCLGCHSTADKQGELDLEQFATLADVRRAPQAWQKVAEMLAHGEMPPKDADQPSAAEMKQLREWVQRYLNAEAHASAGDPGPVALRRLNNAEYNYTILDLTQVDLRPTREFPADSAAGEGFTNASQALVMSPALLTKYLDAGKEIARHAMLLPDGLRFSPSATRRDWSDELMTEIKALYARYSDAEGHLPLEPYLLATLEERDALESGSKSIAEIAQARNLSPRYLATLWQSLTASDDSILLASLRTRWRAATPADVAALAGEIHTWQQALSRFQNVGHMKPWIVTVDPLQTTQELKLQIPTIEAGQVVTVYLAASDAGDGAAGDAVVWHHPRLAIPGRPDLALRDVREFVAQLASRRERLFASAARCLTAAAEVAQSTSDVDVDALARQQDVDPSDLAAWLEYLGIRSSAEIELDLLTEKITQSAGYNFVQGYGSGETPNVVANASDQHVRIPGNAKPHGVVVHPSPTLAIGAGWRSPVSAAMRIEGAVTSAHPECGNGVTWSLELRRGATRQMLAKGISAGAQLVQVGPVENIAIRQGDFVSLLIGPRDGNHACDLTDIELVLSTGGDHSQVWNLTADVSPDLLAGNPHADRQGNAGVWHFYTEPVSGVPSGPVIPADSILARWQAVEGKEEKNKLAEELQSLLLAGPPAGAQTPNGALYRQLASLGGPLFAGAQLEANNAAGASGNLDWGLDPTLFGKSPSGEPIDAHDLCVAASSVLELKLPADLVGGCELLATAALHPVEGRDGTAQVEIASIPPKNTSTLRADAPILVGEAGTRREALARACEDFRRLFPAALCYNRIVPVDEAVTLTLFHREDESLARLMLDDRERADLDRLWSELHYVSQDALTQVDAFAQLMEYATQDSDPRLFEPYREPIHRHAAEYRQQLIDTEPQHLAAALALAGRAYRRPLRENEQQELKDLYTKLRGEDIPHEEAIRLLVARIFVSPAFLYRVEEAASGKEARPISDTELASRLSYFLWSSCPDEELRDLAAAGALHTEEAILAQTRRLSADPRVRRMAVEFASQWIHVYDFDTLDEKSEQHYPEFKTLRGDMYEEAIRFFTDLIQRDGSVLDVLDADYTFVNERLAAFYGIEGVSGDEWRRVEGVRSLGRGGILGFASTLAKQSGASRTSPTLRGAWVSEVLLGEKLPRPPKDVPQIPEDETATAGLTVRQLVEKHASDPRCSTCHVRVDPFGFALEEFDAIGRRRQHDLADRSLDTNVTLRDGTQFAGQEGLRAYLRNERRDALLRQFCRKLLGYALGRGVQLSDEPLLAEMQSRLASRDYRFSAAVEAIVVSPQFREIRGQEYIGIEPVEPTEDE
ncbi:MAG: DUF1592 domain-containing protein [Pirellulales bacterium]|nr:DUF1592 domain-containing protein [Pirellulales bacterium]